VDGGSLADVHNLTVGSHDEDETVQCLEDGSVNISIVIINFSVNTINNIIIIKNILG